MSLIHAAGYEDHVTTEPFHFLHHRYFEGNYAGQGAAFLDIKFGTFIEKVKEPEPAKARPDPKASLRTLPTASDSLYFLCSSACMAAWAFAASQTSPVNATLALILSGLAAFGPMALAVILSVVLNGASLATLSEPFSKQPGIYSWLHLAVGVLLCPVTILLLCRLAFVQPAMLLVL